LPDRDIFNFDGSFVKKFTVMNAIHVIDKTSFERVYFDLGLSTFEP